MTNVPANLLLVKYRQQFGLRPFIQIALLGYALSTLLAPVRARLLDVCPGPGSQRSYGEWPDHADGALFPARHAARQAPGRRNDRPLHSPARDSACQVLSPDCSIGDWHCSTGSSWGLRC